VCLVPRLLRRRRLAPVAGLATLLEGWRRAPAMVAAPDGGSWLVGRRLTSYLSFALSFWSFAVLSLPATEQRRRRSSSRRAGEYVEEAVDGFRAERHIRRHR